MPGADCLKEGASLSAVLRLNRDSRLSKRRFAQSQPEIIHLRINKSRGFGSKTRALALSRLGEAESGKRLLQPWRDLGAQNKLTAEDCYTAGMLASIEERTDTAQTDFRHALGLDPSLWQARVRLELGGDRPYLSHARHHEEVKP